MSNRRQFLGTLGKALGAGGLLLPWAGKGALALPADLGTAARLPVTATALPFSSELLQLREVRRGLRRCWLHQHNYPGTSEYSTAWRDLMQDRHTPLAERIAQRSPATWTDVVELAEVCWEHVAHRRSLRADGIAPWLHPHEAASEALVDAVLTLGGGERFYTRGGEERPSGTWERPRPRVLACHAEDWGTTS
jgi:hypothetical protein